MGKNNRKRKMRGPGKGQSQKNGSEGNEKGVRKYYEDIVKENAKFEKYYQLQKICPEGEWDTMMASIRESLPTTFRITGSRSEAKSLLHIIEKQINRDADVDGKSDDQIDIKPFPLPWYPDNLAWQLNLTRKDIRRSESYFRLHHFLISETESGNISRQEAVSMIPPLALKVEPHHKVLDMCASPGSKTAQIIEMLHAGDSIPEGYVLANDLDNKRCYMLVHQGKRLQSPAFVVTNHDASRYPDVITTDKDGQKKTMKFDRVLCDVPCSGDGTIRKNIDVWKKWSPSNGLYLHMVQYQILKRGLELLEVGGRLVYSTCSFNPMEDEAVIHRMLKEANGSVELLDIDLPHLKHTEGMSHWKVCDRDLLCYDKIEDVPQRWITTIRPYIFPPSKEDAPMFHLDKCMRVLPHHQDTGGFFIALLSKTKPLAWETTEPRVIDTEINTAEDTQVESKHLPPPPKKAKKIQGFKEDPFVFMADDHPIWPKIKDFYGLDPALESSNFLRRTHDGKIRNIYLTTKSVRDFVTSNDTTMKIINVGVKAIARIDNKWSPCDFRLSQEGLPSFCPYIKARRITVSKAELVLMLKQNEDEKAPLMELFSQSTQAQVAKIDRGSLVLISEFKLEDDGPQCLLELVGWKGATSLRAYIQKSDRLHYLRICGVDLSKYEINKFKDKEIPLSTGEGAEKDNGNTKEVEAVECAGMEVQNPA